MSICYLNFIWHDAQNVIVQLFSMSICGQEPASGISLFKHGHTVVESHALRASFLTLMEKKYMQQIVGVSNEGINMGYNWSD
jgi:hypothetical protein